jgi:hypothetical protein
MKVIEKETPYARCVEFHLLKWRFGVRLYRYLCDDHIDVSYGPFTLKKVFDK